LTDPQAWNWLNEHEVPGDRGDIGELKDYTLPAYETFTRYLSAARTELGANKHSPRAGRSHGRSVVRRDQVESEPD
jgi:hypothetical protein